MPITIPSFLTNPQITGIVRTTDLPANYVMQRWFPLQEVPFDEFESLIALDQSELAPFVAVDAETPTMPDDIMSSYKWQVAYIRFKKRFRESDLRVFWEPGVGDPNTLAAASAAAAEAKVRRYVDALSQSIDARLEWMGTQAIGGSLAYNDTHVQYTVTFDGAYIGATKRKAPSTLWNQSSPTIITDLSNWIEGIAEETNIDRWVMLAPRRVLGVMARDSGVRQMWQSSANNAAAQAPGSLNPVSTGQLSVSMEPLGITEIIQYDTRYSTQSGAPSSRTRTLTRFLANTDIFLLPADEPLGRMATAPAQANNWRSGKFAWSLETQDPWTVETGAGIYSFIDFPPPWHNRVLQARVLTA